MGLICLFCFYFHYSRWQIQKLLLQCMSKSVLPMFSPRNFIVSSLTFRCLIHFEFIFKYGVRECSDSILLHVAIQLSQHHLLKRLSFPYCMLWLSFQTLFDCTHWCLILGSLFCSIDLYVCFYVGTILVWYLWLCPFTELLGY